MRLNYFWILLGIIILTFGLILGTYAFPSKLLREILGIPFLLFFPGFALIAAIAPRQNDMGTTERLGLSLILSIAVASTVGLILHYTSFGITLDSILVIMAYFVELVSGIGLVRQAMLPKKERAFLDFKPKIFQHDSGALNTTFMMIMLFVIIGALFTGVYYAFAPKQPEAFTQFYIVQQEGGALYSPAELATHDQASVILGITNHEGGQVNYRVEALVNGETYIEIDSISLLEGQQWQNEISFTPESSGEKQIEFLLFKDNENNPYLRPLRLWIDVAGK